MEIFLKAKHWMIFVITFGLPLLFEIIAMPFMIMENNPMLIMKVMPIMMFFCMGGLFGWLWAIATGLQFKVPPGVKMKVKKFKIFFFIPLVYIVLIIAFLGFVLAGMSENMPDPSGAMIGGLIAIIIPVHFFCMFCILYCLYFTSKTYKTVELQREVSFSDFAGEFFMIWFYPIGIWIIQPKVNKMIENKESRV